MQAYGAKVLYLRCDRRRLEDQRNGCWSQRSSFSCKGVQRAQVGGGWPGSGNVPHSKESVHNEKCAVKDDQISKRLIHAAQMV